MTKSKKCDLLHQSEPASWSELVVFSSTWAAFSGALLYAASSQILGSFRFTGFALVLCGTLTVYNIDRLRDIERDRSSAPRRSAFIEAHVGALWQLVWVAGILSVGLAIPFGLHGVSVLTPALFLGLFHRRLKNLSVVKPWYVAGAWTLVIGGLPAKDSPDLAVLPSVAGLVAVSIFANTLVSGAITRTGARKPALGLAALGVSIAVLGEDTLRPLAAIPAFLFVALLPSRQNEWYRLCAIDGALGVGATVATLTIIASSS